MCDSCTHDMGTTYRYRAISIARVQHGDVRTLTVKVIHNSLSHISTLTDFAIGSSRTIPESRSAFGLHPVLLRHLANLPDDKVGCGVDPDETDLLGILVAFGEQWGFRKGGLN